MKITDTVQNTIKYYYINIKNSPAEMVSAIKQFVESYHSDADIGITAGTEAQIEIQTLSLTEFTKYRAAALFSHIKERKHSWHTVLLFIDNCSREEILPIIQSVLKYTKQNLILLCDYNYWNDKTNYFKKAKEIVPKWRETHPPIPGNSNFTYKNPNETTNTIPKEEPIVNSTEDIILQKETKKKNTQKLNLLEFIGNIPHYLICIIGFILTIAALSFYGLLPALYYIASIFGMIISGFMKWFQ